jgi:hypothetical protein
MGGSSSEDMMPWIWTGLGEPEVPNVNASETTGKRYGVGLTLIALTIATLAGGTANLMEASHSWQRFLDSVRTLNPSDTCPGNFSVSGWSDIAVLLMLGTALLALGLAVVAIHHGHGWDRVGVASGFVAVLMSFLLWMGAFGVAGSSLGDCDGIGLSGAASVAVNRAGWLLFVSVVLSLAIASWFQLRTGSWFQ